MLDPSGEKDDDSDVNASPTVDTHDDEEGGEGDDELDEEDSEEKEKEESEKNKLDLAADLLLETGEMGSSPDPPENCHLTVKKLQKT